MTRSRISSRPSLSGAEAIIDHGQSGHRGSWLAGKQILLISPQPWDHMPISKHHYAEALGSSNSVWFLDPPDWSLSPGTIRQQDTGIPGVVRVTWRPRVLRALRFHAHGLYRYWIGLEARRLVRRLGTQFDLVWCFDFNTFPDLRAFGAGRAIFHPVDPLTTPRQYAIGRTADLILSVSQQILSSATSVSPGVANAVINHGIGPDFAALAARPVQDHVPGETIRCGYFGNLDRGTINVALIAETVARCPNISFHFWGPFSPDSPLPSALRESANCVFHGAMGKPALVEAVSEMDCFILAYLDHAAESDRSNAHKILEYFATGRAVISTRMNIYADDADLMVMAQAADDADFPDRFLEVISDLPLHNSRERQMRRRALALEHTYPRNIARIDAMLSVPGSAWPAEKEMTQ
ncbi:MAG: glycosyltransferase [Minwuia sp.]|nr:glycosyltransferase [Minwuia sp.]